MFDIGFSEMVVVGVVALLVIGPERLPTVAAKTGRFIAKARAFVATTRSDIEREFQAEELRSILSKQENEIRELRNIMKSKVDSLQQDIRTTSSSVEASVRQAAVSTTKQAETVVMPAPASTTPSSPSESDDPPKHG